MSDAGPSTQVGDNRTAGQFEACSRHLARAEHAVPPAAEAAGLAGMGQQAAPPGKICGFPPSGPLPGRGVADLAGVGAVRQTVKEPRHGCNGSLHCQDNITGELSSLEFCTEIHCKPHSLMMLAWDMIARTRYSCMHARKAHCCMEYFRQQVHTPKGSPDPQPCHADMQLFFPHPIACTFASKSLLANQGLSCKAAAPHQTWVVVPLSTCACCSPGVSGVASHQLPQELPQDCAAASAYQAHQHQPAPLLHSLEGHQQTASPKQDRPAAGAKPSNQSNPIWGFHKLEGVCCGAC